MNSNTINNCNNTLDQVRRGAVRHRHPSFYVLTTLCSTTLPHRRTTRPRPVLNLKGQVRPCRTITSTRYVNHDALSMTIRPRPSGDLSLTTFTLSFPRRLLIRLSVFRPRSKRSLNRVQQPQTQRPCHTPPSIRYAFLALSMTVPRRPSHGLSSRPRSFLSCTSLSADFSAFTTARSEPTRHGG